MGISFIGHGPGVVIDLVALGQWWDCLKVNPRNTVTDPTHYISCENYYFQFSVDIMKQLGCCSYSDSIILATGDADFMPVIMEALLKTHNIEIWSFQSGDYPEFPSLVIFNLSFSSG